MPVAVRRSAIRHRQPLLRLRGEITIIAEDASGKEVPFDPLHERFNASLLVPGSRITGLGMEAELGGELEQCRGPDGPMGGITATGHGLHIVEDQHPGHERQREEAVDQSPD